MNIELKENFRKTLIQFVRDNGINMTNPEFVKLIRSWFESLSHDYNTDNEYSREFDKNTPAYQKLQALHESIIAQCIDFINSNEDIKQMIEEKREIVRNEWNKPDDKIQIEPDVRMYFAIDNLDESIKAGKWTPGSDSSISLKVGSTNILNIC